MIRMTASTHILLATQPADFRKGIDGFVALCTLDLAQDARSGSLFVFINRSKTMVRILSYDGTGFWLLTKRLSKGKFTGWPKEDAPLSDIAARHLNQLLQVNAEHIRTSPLKKVA